uniref:Uncharacterized protein n=1 Tax=Caulobacter sp. (strain K31) TaxID=366602 RepID=B0T0U4_CAUSK
MKKILLSIVAASAIAVAVPAVASAQAYGYDRGDRGGWDHGDDRGDRGDRGGWDDRGDRGGWNHGGDRAARLDQRIDINVRNGTLNRRGAMRLKSELRDTVRLADRWARDGLSRAERAELDRRFDRISAQIDYRADRDRDYGYGYGYGRR